MPAKSIDHEKIKELRAEGIRWKEVALAIGYKYSDSSLRSSHNQYMKNHKEVVPIINKGEVKMDTNEKIQQRVDTISDDVKELAIQLDIMKNVKKLEIKLEFLRKEMDNLLADDTDDSNPENKLLVDVATIPDTVPEYKELTPALVSKIMELHQDDVDDDEISRLLEISIEDVYDTIDAMQDEPVVDVE